MRRRSARDEIDHVARVASGAKHAAPAGGPGPAVPKPPRFSASKFHCGRPRVPSRPSARRARGASRGRTIPCAARGGPRPRRELRPAWTWKCGRSRDLERHAAARVAARIRTRRRDHSPGSTTIAPRAAASARRDRTPRKRASASPSAPRRAGRPARGSRRRPAARAQRVRGSAASPRGTARCAPGATRRASPPRALPPSTPRSRGIEAVERRRLSASSWSPRTTTSVRTGVAGGTRCDGTAFRTSRRGLRSR
jgi:hypothetical protein